MTIFYIEIDYFSFIIHQAVIRFVVWSRDPFVFTSFHVKILTGAIEVWLETYDDEVANDGYLAKKIDKVCWES